MSNEIHTQIDESLLRFVAIPLLQHLVNVPFERHQRLGFERVESAASSQTEDDHQKGGRANHHPFYIIKFFGETKL